MKKTISSIVFVVSILLSYCVMAQTHDTHIKIGYTNVEYILSRLPEAKQIEADLKAYEKLLETQLESKYQEYQKKLEDYQAQVASGLMPPSVKADKERELLNLQTSIREFEQNAEQDLQNKQVTLLEPVLKKVQDAIDKVAAANNYTYIFSSHTDFGGSAIILYAKNKEKDDISDTVLKELGVDVTATGTTGTTTTGTPTTGTTTTPKPTTTGTTTTTPSSGIPKK
ncbi:MAG: OmpH family outer membrane protein [Cytophagaceae bacterium]|jgi:outer membrane protein|nr:OmpH family outer membrane protein [Cytophagaceae bacterium]